MIREKRETKKILHFGKLPNQKNLFGPHLGEMEDLAGILNAQPWLVKFWERILTFILVESTLSSLTIRMSWLNLKHSMIKQTG
jgi:hypothetical protein